MNRCPPAVCFTFFFGDGFARTAWRSALVVSTTTALGPPQREQPLDRQTGAFHVKGCQHPRAAERDSTPLLPKSSQQQRNRRLLRLIERSEFEPTQRTLRPENAVNGQFLDHGPRRTPDRAELGAHRSGWRDFPNSLFGRRNASRTDRKGAEVKRRFCPWICVLEGLINTSGHHDLGDRRRTTDRKTSLPPSDAGRTPRAGLWRVRVSMIRTGLYPRSWIAIGMPSLPVTPV